MRLKLLLECKLQNRLELNLQRNCVFHTKLRPNILSDGIYYVSFITDVYEENSLMCEVVVAISSDYSIKNCATIFKVGKSIDIIEGNKRLAQCIIKEVSKNV